MATVIKVPHDARFFSNLSNARRALKKVLAVDTATANELIHQEALEDGGRYWYSESQITKLSVEVDKATEVQVTTQVPVAPVHNPIQSTKSRCEVRNGVRKPLKGKCADVWAELDSCNEYNEITIAEVRLLAVKNNWNLTNATIEFYAWRKFHGYNKK